MTKATNLLAISFYKPVQPSVANGNERCLTSRPSEQTNAILNPKAEAGIFVTEIHTDRSTVDSGLLAPANRKGAEIIRKEAWKTGGGDELTAARFTHSADTAQWKYFQDLNHTSANQN